MLRVNSGNWVTQFHDNSIYISSLTQSRDIILLRNQIAPSIKNNTIETLSVLAFVQINIRATSVFSLGEPPQVIGNFLKTRIIQGDAISVGSEGSTLGDFAYDRAIIQGNTIFGPLYYNDSLASVEINAIFCP